MVVIIFFLFFFFLYVFSVYIFSEFKHDYKQGSRQQHLPCQRGFFMTVLNKGHTLFSLPPCPFVSIYSVFILQLKRGKMSISSEEEQHWTCGRRFHFQAGCITWRRDLICLSDQNMMPQSSEWGSFSLTLLFRPAAFCSVTYNECQEKLFSR